MTVRMTQAFRKLLNHDCLSGCLNMVCVTVTTDRDGSDLWLITVRWEQSQHPHLLASVRSDRAVVGLSQMQCH